MTFDLVAQYQPRGTTVRILDRESAVKWRFIEVSEDALSKEYDFHIMNAPALGSKPMRVNQLVQLLTILLQTKDQTGFQVDYKALLRKILEEMDIPNPQEILGFPQFQQPLPQLQGDEGPTSTQDFIPPQEENRLMIEQHQAVYPKLEEDHASHRVFHREAYDEIAGTDSIAANLISEHDSAHGELMIQSRSLLANAMSSQMVAGQAQQQMQQANMLTSNKTESPMGAGGREAPQRALGNLFAGNV
jgi:hypothetical protein